MKAFHFQYLVDAYGDIPYSQAFQGASNVRPAYDDAQDIYNDLIVQLTAAQTLISSADSSVLIPSSTVDVMCGGDMGKWARFANTLKLRILLRQSAIGVTDYSSVNNGIGYLGADETVYCNPGYSNDTNKQNPFYAAFGKTIAGDPAANTNATRVTPFALSLVPATDGRRSRLFKTVGTTSNYAGIEQNQPGGTNSASLSGLGDGVISSSSQSAIIMSGAESMFLQAEAVVRGFIPGNDTALVEAGVQASFDQLGATGAAAVSANYDGSVGFIITQKFVANMHTNGFENYTEYRRTGFPAVPVAPNASQPTLPVRLLYPSSEVNTNPNVPSQQTTDAFTSKIFWDL